MPEGDTPAEWVEVNIEPPSYDQREKLLLDVVDPLIHEVLRNRVGDWHYFWEPALRLRIRWQQPTQADYTWLTDFLNAAEADGKLAGWEEGSHGGPGQVYPGEAEKFGADIWPYTYPHWTTGCELNAMGFRYLGINARFPVLVTVGSSWWRACRRPACRAG